MEATIKQLAQKCIVFAILASPVIHLILIFTLPFMFVISVEEGLEWDAHIIYAAFHFLILLFQVYILQITKGDFAADYQQNFEVQLPEIIQTEDKYTRLMVSVVLALNSQFLLLDNYTDVAFLAITASDQQYRDFCTVSAVFFALFWFLRILICLKMAYERRHVIDNVFIAIFTGLEFFEYDIFPLFPLAELCWPQCQKPKKDEEKIIKPKDFSDRIMAKVAEQPFKVIRAGLEDYSQAIIQLAFWIVADASSTAWFGVGVSIFFCIKNFRPFTTLLSVVFCWLPIQINRNRSVRNFVKNERQGNDLSITTATIRPDNVIEKQGYESGYGTTVRTEKYNDKQGDTTREEKIIRN